jgi:arsenate reductase-like glutaredoxin family protein
MSNGEFESVLRAIGGIDKLINWDKKDPDIDLMKYMDDRIAKEDKVFDRVELMKTPIVRNGKKATVGYCPEVWETWD